MPDQVGHEDKAMEAEGIVMAETCGRPRPHEREGPTSEAQWEGRAVEDCEGRFRNKLFVFQHRYPRNRWKQVWSCYD